MISLACHMYCHLFLYLTDRNSPCWTVKLLLFYTTSSHSHHRLFPGSIVITFLGFFGPFSLLISPMFDFVWLFFSFVLSTLTCHVFRMCFALSEFSLSCSYFPRVFEAPYLLLFLIVSLVFCCPTAHLSHVFRRYPSLFISLMFLHPSDLLDTFASPTMTLS